MKNYIQQKIQNIQNTNRARCIVREYLQARTLECLQENHAFVDWAFVGATLLNRHVRCCTFTLPFTTVPISRDNWAEAYNIIWEFQLNEYC